MRRSPRSTIFPYTTLFRSQRLERWARGWSCQTENLNRKDRKEKQRTQSTHLRQDEILGNASMSALRSLFFFAILDRKSTRLNSSHLGISYAVFCLKKKNTK